MLLLTVDSSRFTGSAGLFEEGESLMTVTFNTKATYSEKLLFMIDFLLKESGKTIGDVGLIGVNSGPGSFTGLRIGMSVCKGLAYAKNIPIVKVNTLHMAARHAASAPGLYAPVMDARKEQVFAALLEKTESGWREVLPSGAYSLDALVSKNEFSQPVTFLGDGAGKYRQRIEELLPGKDFSADSTIRSYPDICAALAMESYAKNGAEDLFALEPDYYRASDAEINHDKHKKTDAL